MINITTQASARGSDLNRISRSRTWRGGIMPRKSTNISKVTSEAEESEWSATPQGRRQTQREFAQALKDGTLIRATGVENREHRSESARTANGAGQANRHSRHLDSRPDRRS